MWLFKWERPITLFFVLVTFVINKWINLSVIFSVSRYKCNIQKVYCMFVFFFKLHLNIFRTSKCTINAHDSFSLFDSINYGICNIKYLYTNSVIEFGNCLVLPPSWVEIWEWLFQFVWNSYRGKLHRF